METETIALLLEVIDQCGITRVDLTGGAPELHAGFRNLVSALRKRQVTVIDRCNLTILSEPGQEDLATFLAYHQVEVVASLPCYSRSNVDRQRGDGVFARSIAGLQQLNAQGYADGKSGLTLNLVYNPQGPQLPPDQLKLEAEYKRALKADFNIVFDQLFTLANMPIQRFGSTLISRGKFDDYLALLKRASQPGNLAGVMCRSQVSVDWQGFIYDCDFNQMLSMPATLENSKKPHLRDLLRQSAVGKPINVAQHCYGCTAGQGSSCSGALTSAADRLIASG